MTPQLPTRRIEGWTLFGLISFLVVAMSAITLALNPDIVEGTRGVIRATARSSFVLFLAAFTASALATLVPTALTRTLVRERRYIGLAFAVSHLVHAIAIYAYGQLAPEFWPGRTWLTNVPGSVGYLFILLMAITSFKGPASLLGPKGWKRLHTTGMWVIAAIFAYSYFKRIPMSYLYAVPFAILCSAAAVRVVGKVSQSVKRNQAAQRVAMSRPVQAS